MNLQSLKSILFIAFLFAFSSCLSEDIRLKDNPSITINVDYSPNRETIFLGENGVLFLTTSYNDNEANIFDESDIEEKTAFSTIITDWNSNQYHVKGRLWKPKNKELILLYKFDQSTIIYDCNLYFNDISFYYKATQVNIHFSYTYFYARRIDSKVPFLYGNEQTINL